MGIAKGLGKPLKVDLTTSNLERGRFARVCVEVNLKKPLKGTVLINGQRYYVSYEGLTTICSSCGLYGHLIHACPTTVQERAANTQATSSEVNGGNNIMVPVDEGFIPIRQRGRKAENYREKQGVTGGSQRSRLGVTARETSGKELASIPIANSFGRLEADLEGLEIQEANKENTSHPNIVNSKQSAGQARGIVFGAGSAKAVSEKQFRTGKGGKKVGATKPQDRPKTQSNNSRSMRGLVFGPIGKDIELSSNGKRLRVETETMGRSSGRVAHCVRESGDEGDTMMMRESVTNQMQNEPLAERAARESVGMEVPLTVEA